MSTTLEAWIFFAAITHAPPQHVPQFPGFEESIYDTVERYETIAHDIAEAVKDRKDAKSAAALLLAWAIGETHLARDADLGPCYREGAYRTRCDGGRAATLWQLHDHHDRKTGEFIDTEPLFDDRPRAVRIALAGLYQAWTSCRHLKPEDRFSGFGIGSCIEGNVQVRKRYALWQTIRGWSPR